MSRLRAIIFDFDGVLADTERLHLRAFQDALAQEGIDLTAAEYAARYLGHADAEVFKGLARDRAIALDRARLESLLVRKAARYDALVASGAVMIRGVAEKVRAWSEVMPLGVASGARRSEIEHLLDAAALLPYFAAVVAAEDVARGKPGPDPYVLALRRINQAGGGRREADPVAPDEVVAIEDSPSGLASIAAAGMHAVAVTTNYPRDVLAPAAELVVTSIAELDLDALAAVIR